MKYVIRELKDKIVSYHLHNNEDKDNHDSISYGKLSMEKFIEAYKKYTDKADLVLEYNKNYREKVDILIGDIDYIKSKI